MRITSFSFVVLLTSAGLAAGCGDDSGSGGSSSNPTGLEGACEDYCAAALGQSCGDLQISVEQCQAQCGMLELQTKGFCENEAADAYQCLADGGFDCTEYDSDGDGVNDTSVPTPKATCLNEQQAQLTCESEAGCDRFCAEADEEGCGGAACVSACEARRTELTDATSNGNCGFSYNLFVQCGSLLGVSCAGGSARPAEACIESAFGVGECLQEDAETVDLCATYCFAADEYACGTGCDAQCAAQVADPTCGSQWSSLLDCIIFFGDAACEGDAILPTVDGICSSERDAYQACAG